MKLAGTKVTVVGMGRSGASAIVLLHAHGAVVTAVDQKPGGVVHGVTVQAQDAAAFADAELVVVSPGVPADLDVLQAARARGVKVIGELELAAPFLRGTTIGITGSNGKTTTTALIGHILRESGVACQVGGNIGTPPTAMIDASREGQYNVLELSSFQLETIETFHAQIGVALNVTDNHLDRHYTLARYAAAKARLFENQTAEDYAILNADNAHTAGFASLIHGHLLWFSSTQDVAGASIRDGAIALHGEPLMPTAEIPLKGLHNVENVMAASLAAQLAGAQIPQIAAAIRTFPGVEHRLEAVRTLNGVAYYNDSKATSVDATLKAIDAFAGNLWIVLGGKDKKSDYTVLREPLRAKAHAALLIGAAAEKIAAQLAGAVPLIAAGTLDLAVERAAQAASPGDVVLLAPACASFDQFKSFEHRGEVFKQLVRQLPERPA
jgi:UDP-N-acetylmuramoylalanine--D-glutamate ligase